MGGFFVCCVSDLDAKPCVADLDAGRFCRGQTNPRACMGGALDRYLPGCCAMLVNEVYVKSPRATKRLLSAVCLFCVFTDKYMHLWY